MRSTVVFPVPFLKRLNDFVEDADLSSLAQTCTQHMALCYFRASQILHWNHPLAIYNLQAGEVVRDPWLMYQVARIYLLDNRDRHSSAPFSLSFYMQYKFSDPAPHTRMSTIWYKVYHREEQAKLVCAINCSNESVYLNLYQNFYYDFYVERAIEICSISPYQNDKAVLIAIWAIFGCRKDSFKDLILDYEYDGRCFAHPLIFSAIRVCSQNNDRFCAQMLLNILSPDSMPEINALLDNYPAVDAAFSQVALQTIRRLSLDCILYESIEILTSWERTRSWAIPFAVRCFKEAINRKNKNDVEEIETFIKKYES